MSILSEVDTDREDPSIHTKLFVIMSKNHFVPLLLHTEMENHAITKVYKW